MNPLPSQGNGGNFMDRNTLVALVLVMIMFIGWQSYMDRKYPPTTRDRIAEDVVANEPQPVKADAASAAAVVEGSQEASPKLARDFEEELFRVASDSLEFQVSSRGLGLRQITLKDYTDREGEPVVLGDPKGEVQNYSLAWADTDEPVLFSVEQTGPYEFQGISQDRPEWSITRRWVFSPVDFHGTVVTEVSGSMRGFPGLKTLVVDQITDREKNFLFPSFEYQDVFAISEGNEQRDILDPEELRRPSASGEKIIGQHDGVTMMSLSRQYFSLALMDESDTLPSVTFDSLAMDNLVRGVVTSRPLTNQSPFTLVQKIYFGPKSIDLLSEVDGNLPAIMDLGFFSSLAKPLLRFLTFFHGFVGNWGLAIIALTLLVRTLLLPLNITAFRSMKKMQLLQEPMKAIREKYKDDRQKLNEEVAALFKKERVNPLGGCLPMLLQLPIFLALYQVFSKSIELYQAPFVFWITDLSSKDPYYVLPLLMGVTMFLQQVLTPSTMDPAQRKIMLVLPVVFSLMMISLPSGLTLYIFISTLFGVIQQLLMTRDRAPVVAETVKA